MTRRAFAGVVLGVLLPLVILLYPGDWSLSARQALAISAFTVVFWTFEPVLIEYTSLVVLLLFPVLQLIPFETAFAAFSGKAIWLIFAGMALSLSITETPLGARLASLFLGRVRSYGRLLLGLHLLGILSAILIPSGMIRIVILMPLVISLLKALGEKPASPVSAALVLSLACSTYYGGTGILTASVPNLVVLGVMESREVQVYWGQWAGYLFPVFGLIRTGCCYVLIRLVYSTPQALAFSSTSAEVSHVPEKTTPAEKKSLAVLVLGILLWATDALHGIHPAYIGLFLVLLCYLPGWGPLSPKQLKGVNFPILIYVAAMFAVGHALETTGTSLRLARAMADWLDLLQQPPAVRLGAITGLMAPFNFLTDTAAIAGILTPVLLDIGAGLGLQATHIGLSVAIGTSLVFIPYQAAPFVLAYSFRYARMGQFILLMSLLSVATLILLLPLNLLYWHVTGLLP